MFGFKKKLEMPSAAEALPGRPTAIPTAKTHFINGNPLKGPYPAGYETAMFGMGCFWGAERKFWELGDGIYATAVGYAAGQTPNVDRAGFEPAGWITPRPWHRRRPGRKAPSRPGRNSRAAPWPNTAGGSPRRNRTVAHRRSRS